MHNHGYNPGDVPVIHPFAAASEVDSFLVTMGWANIAGDLFTVKHTTLGVICDT